jgi:opacity protein-like surface antigen
MNKTLVLSSLLALSTSVMAMDVTYFIGAGAERGSVKTKADTATVTKFEDTGLKLKAGAIFNKNQRLSLSYVTFNKDGGNLDLTELSYDYLIPLKNKFSVLAGVHAGYAKYKASPLDMKGYDYGLQTGLLYDITSNIQLETSIAYSKYNVDDTVNNIKFELDHSTAFYLGFNYKF